METPFTRVLRVRLGYRCIVVVSTYKPRVVIIVYIIITYSGEELMSVCLGVMVFHDNSHAYVKLTTAIWKNKIKTTLSPSVISVLYRSRKIFNE